ncbi:MAG: hypothetical protein JWM37_486 [Candidatus Saccharibacteria bacterium]|nr:hypothetical protein [Candidatus Saccharibacteria bacterium]
MKLDMSSPEASGPPPGIKPFEEDGSVNAAYFRDVYALEPEEAEAPVEYGGHRGTFAQALEDEACPIGEGFRGMVRDAESPDEARQRVIQGIKGMAFIPGMGEVTKAVVQTLDYEKKN